MLGGMLYHHSHGHASKPLVVRGGLGRTFGSLISFLALTLLTFGGYVLVDAFAHPVQAFAAAIIAAACAIALSLLLLFYLLKPRKGEGARKDPRRSHPHRRRANSVSRLSPVIRRDTTELGQLSYQRIYVDPYRVRA